MNEQNQDDGCRCEAEMCGCDKGGGCACGGTCKCANKCSCDRGCACSKAAKK